MCEYCSSNEERNKTLNSETCQYSGIEIVITLDNILRIRVDESTSQEMKTINYCPICGKKLINDMIKKENVFDLSDLLCHECEHKWVYLETRKQKKAFWDNGDDKCYKQLKIKYQRNDVFFCEKCLKEKELVKEEITGKNKSEIPEWY